jgi:hypothetical protein
MISGSIRFRLSFATFFAKYTISDYSDWQMSKA